MGAFNVLKVKSPVTGEPIRIQFKYGERWQHEYSLGDLIAYPPGIHARDARVTLVGGVTEPPMQSAESEHYEIRFEYGVPVSIRALTEAEYDRLEAY